MPKNGQGLVSIIVNTYYVYFANKQETCNCRVNDKLGLKDDKSDISSWATVVSLIFENLRPRVHDNLFLSCIIYICIVKHFCEKSVSYFCSEVLAQRGYLKEPNFINYLKYLLYWKEPRYAKYLKWVMVLLFLF